MWLNFRMTTAVTQYFRTPQVPRLVRGLPRTLHGASSRTTLTAQSVKAHYLAYTNRLKKLMLPQSLKRSAVSMRYSIRRAQNHALYLASARRSRTLPASRHATAGVIRNRPLFMSER